MVRGKKMNDKQCMNVIDEIFVEIFGQKSPVDINGILEERVSVRIRFAKALIFHGLILTNTVVTVLPVLILSYFVSCAGILM